MDYIGLSLQLPGVKILFYFQHNALHNEYSNYKKDNNVRKVFEGVKTP